MFSLRCLRLTASTSRACARPSGRNGKGPGRSPKRRGKRRWRPSCSRRRRKKRPENASRRSGNTRRRRCAFLARVWLRTLSRQENTPGGWEDGRPHPAVAQNDRSVFVGSTPVTKFWLVVRVAKRKPEGRQGVGGEEGVGGPEGGGAPSQGRRRSQAVSKLHTEVASARSKRDYCCGHFTQELGQRRH